MHRTRMQKLRIRQTIRKAQIRSRSAVRIRRDLREIGLLGVSSLVDGIGLDAGSGNRGASLRRAAIGR